MKGSRIAVSFALVCSIASADLLAAECTMNVRVKMEEGQKEFKLDGLKIEDGVPFEVKLQDFAESSEMMSLLSKADIGEMKIQMNSFTRFPENAFYFYWIRSPQQRKPLVVVRELSQQVTLSRLSSNAEFSLNTIAMKENFEHQTAVLFAPVEYREDSSTVNCLELAVTTTCTFEAINKTPNATVSPRYFYFHPHVHPMPKPIFPARPAAPKPTNRGPAPKSISGPAPRPR